jgi:hypothetical protein
MVVVDEVFEKYFIIKSGVLLEILDIVGQFCLLLEHLVFFVIEELLGVEVQIVHT